MKKIILCIIILMICTPLINAIDPEYIYVENFDDDPVGGLPTSDWYRYEIDLYGFRSYDDGPWMNHGVSDEQSSTGSNSLKLYTAVPIGQSIGKSKAHQNLVFNQTAKLNYIEMDIWVDDATHRHGAMGVLGESGRWISQLRFQCGNKKGKISIKTGNINVKVIGSYQSNTWYTMRMEFDWINQKVTVYQDSTCLGTYIFCDQVYQNCNGVRAIWFRDYCQNDNTWQYIDNIKVSSPVQLDPGYFLGEVRINPSDYHAKTVTHNSATLQATLHHDMGYPHTAQFCVGESSIHAPYYGDQYPAGNTFSPLLTDITNGTFSATITGLQPDHIYRYWAMVNEVPNAWKRWMDDGGSYRTEDTNLVLTSAYPPTDITSTTNGNQITLDWNNGDYSDSTVICHSSDSYPTNPVNPVYNGTDSTFTHTPTSTSNYYTFWSYNTRTTKEVADNQRPELGNHNKDPTRLHAYSLNKTILVETTPSPYTIINESTTYVDSSTNPHIIPTNLTITSLIIDKGVYIYIPSGISITANGLLQISGTQSNPTILESDNMYMKITSEDSFIAQNGAKLIFP